MRPILLFFVSLFLFQSSFAAVKLSWIDAQTERVPKIKHSQQEIKDRIDMAAKSFMENYQDMGKLDFEKCKKEFVFVFDNDLFPAVMEHWLGPLQDQGADVISIDTGVANKSSLNILEVMFFHEFCHTYDLVMNDRMELASRWRFSVDQKIDFKEKAKKVFEARKNMRGTYKFSRGQSEERAQKRTALYVESIKGRLTPNEYNTLKKHLH